MGELRFIVKMDGKGRVTIPQVIREHLGIYPGAYFELVVNGGTRNIVLKPMIKNLIEGLLVEVVVRVKEVNDLTTLIIRCLNEGYEVIRLNCIHDEAYECTLNLHTVDEEGLNKLRHLLAGCELVNMRSIT